MELFQLTLQIVEVWENPGKHISFQVLEKWFIRLVGHVQKFKLSEGVIKACQKDEWGTYQINAPCNKILCWYPKEGVVFETWSCMGRKVEYF